MLGVSDGAPCVSGQQGAAAAGRAVPPLLARRGAARAAVCLAATARQPPLNCRSSRQDDAVRR